jgi:hypothetical protein
MRSRKLASAVTSLKIGGAAAFRIRTEGLELLSEMPPPYW